jgi:hypothetical protein
MVQREDAMYEHFGRVELPLSIDEFHRLPRNAAYKYEYFGGRAVLTPRPKSLACVRDTEPPGGSPEYHVEPLRAGEMTGYAHLASTFALDNAPSALWHWRNGFRLLPQMIAMDRLITKRRERNNAS